MLIAIVRIQSTSTARTVSDRGSPIVDGARDLLWCRRIGPEVSYLSAKFLRVNTNDTVRRWAARTGFSPPQDFTASAMPAGTVPSARYSGFYLLIFSDDTYYLGESVNLRGRMGQHNAQWGTEISQVRFLLQNLSKQQLKAQEKPLIHELNGLVPQGCRNITHASVTAGIDELEAFVTDAEQRQWLQDPLAFNRSDSATLKPMTKAQEVKYSTKARKFDENPLASELTNALRTYLENCVPAPRRTEFQSWNVSAGSFNGKRAFCVSVGKMESFVASPNGGAFIVVRKSEVLPKHRPRRFRIFEDRPTRDFRRRHPNALIATDRTYDDGGADQVILRAPTLQDLDRLLRDATVLRGAARLAYDVMRKHPSVYARYHCPQLVERVYAEFERPQPELDQPVPADEEPPAELPSQVPDHREVL